MTTRNKPAKSVKHTTKHAAIFGAALSSAFVATEIQADVLDITWDGGQASVEVDFQVNEFCGPPIETLDIDQLIAGPDLRVFFGSYECTLYPASGTVTIRVGSAFRDVMGDIASVGFLDRGVNIDPQTIADLGFLRLDSSGTFFAGFKTNDGNVGWFRVEIDSDSVIVSEGEVATNGESLIVGGTDLCGPAVDLLDGILTIEGTGDADLINVSRENGVVSAELNGCTETFPAGTVKELVINGNDGDDEIVVNFRDRKTIRGGSGDDVITVDGPGSGASIFGEDGDDTIVGGPSPDFIEGGAGNDNLSGRGGRDWLDGGAPVAGSPDMNIINGGNGGDTILGGEDVDMILGGDGADTIYAFGGDDLVEAGAGADQIFGAAGADCIYGGPADDLINGGDGDDGLFGGDGRDSISGGQGADFVIGGSGSDNIQGGAEDDTIFGNEGLDILGGGAGDDVILGGVGNDTISGGPGNDTLLGQSQHDILNGDGGDDTLTGGLGFDELNGGDGTDTATDTGEAGETSIEN